MSAFGRCSTAAAVAMLLQCAAGASTIEIWTEFGMFPPPGPVDEYPASFHILKLYLSSDADIESISHVRGKPSNGARLWQVAPPFGSNVEPPPPLFLQLNASLHADSWLSTPGATTLTGADLPGDGTGTWADETDDGPQTAFHWGTLTTPLDVDMTFTGRINLAGPDGPSGRWFRIDGRTGQVFVPEPATVASSGAMVLILSALLRRSMVAKAIILFAALAALQILPCREASAATVTVRTDFLDVPPCDVCARPDPYEHNRALRLYLTSDADVLSISDVQIRFPEGGELYQWESPFGSNTEAPDPALFPLIRRLVLDCWLTTPGVTTLTGADLPGDGTGTWSDVTNDGPQTDFQWGSLGSDSPFELVCRINLVGPNEPVGRWFRIDGVTGQVSVPEPTGCFIATAALAGASLACSPRRAAAFRHK